MRNGVIAIPHSLWQHRALLLLLVKRDIASCYRGTFLGLLWTLATPLLKLLVYTFVFSVVFKARWNTGSDSRVEFALLLFIGLFIHGFFSECLTRAPGLMLAHANLVKKVAFPLEILPVVMTGTALFNCAVNALVLLLGWILFSMPLHASVLLLPLTLLPLLFLCLGVSWLLAAIGVYIRDVGQSTGLLSMLLLFLAPVFYPQSALPVAFQPWLNLNPLTFIIESSRRVLAGDAINWLHWSLMLAFSLLAALFGAWCFQKGRKGFADVL